MNVKSKISKYSLRIERVFQRHNKKLTTRGTVALTRDLPKRVKENVKRLQRMLKRAVK